jgi:hypothetical protein
LQVVITADLVAHGELCAGKVPLKCVQLVKSAGPRRAVADL